MARMGWLVVCALAAGCYSPKLASPSFYCHANDNPACPDGQSCVGGRCVDTRPSASVAQDLGADSGDLAGPSSPDDLSSPGCLPKGGDCTYHDNAACCSNYCIYKSNTCK